MNDVSNEIIANASLITFGIQTAETYTVTANEYVFWKISGVKFQDNALTSDSDDADTDDRDYLDITLETVSEDDETFSEDEFAEIISGDEFQPNDYGKEAVITVSSIAGYTPKGEYTITVQRFTDDDEWENAKVLTFDASNEGSIDEGMIVGISSSSGGCNTGLSWGIIAFLLGGIMTLRKKR